jgi:hypothetical protein
MTMRRLSIPAGVIADIKASTVLVRAVVVGDEQRVELRHPGRMARLIYSGDAERDSKGGGYRRTRGGRVKMGASHSLLLPGV